METLEIMETPQTCDTGLRSANVPATGRVRLVWQPAEHAERYLIHAGVPGSGEYTLIGTVEFPEYTDEISEPGMMKEYTVQAVDEGDHTWQIGEPVTGVCRLPRPVVRIGNKEATGKNKLSWEAIAGAEKYRIYVKAPNQEAYAKLGTTAKTEFTHISSAAGETYSYKVRAVHSLPQANSALSREKKRMCDLPRPVITLENVPETGKIKISWEPVAGAQSYKVYRSADKDGPYTRLKTTDQTSVIHTSGKSAASYYYQVKAVHANASASSAPSQPRHRTCDLPRPVVTVEQKKGKPRLQWKQISGAVEYVVYGARKENGAYQVLGITGSASFVHMDAVKGKTYYYKVVAASNVSAADSAESKVVSMRA